MNVPRAVRSFVQPEVKRPIHSLLLDEIESFLATLPEKPYRAKQIVDWLYEKRVASFDQMSDLPQALRQRLAEEFAFGNLETVRVLGSNDTTQKFLFRLVDGFSRNLGASEIVQQLLAVEKASGQRIDNVVFMGMGEPLANLTNVARAIRIINAPWGLEIGARHITFSTSGLAPQIKKLADEPIQSRLAISLHGATDEVRNLIMPVNRKYDLTTLLAACDYYARRKKQRIYFEYILIGGVNDSEEQAHLLAGHARRIGARVNLIPYNTVAGLEWSRPPRQTQERFLSIVRGHGVVATLRREKGHDIDAACGQLRLQTKRAEEGTVATRA